VGRYKTAIKVGSYLLAVLAMLLLVAWQRAAPLTLVAEADPAAATSNQTLDLIFTVTNTSDVSLEDVEVRVVLPESTVLVGLVIRPARWTVRTVTGEAQSTVTYRAEEPLAPGKDARLAFRVMVLQEAGESLVVDDYTATAKGLGERIAGESLSVPVGARATPRTATPSPTGTPVPSATAVPTGTPQPTDTPTPRATTTPSVVPSPTYTVVLVELPPTPTPNLSTEQERLGTVTVLIFSGIVVALAVWALIWLIRGKRTGEG